MKSETEIMALISEKLEDALDELWDVLTPAERKRAFSGLVSEYVMCNYGS